MAKTCEELQRRFYASNAEIARLEKQLVQAKAGWDSCILDLRKSAEICAEVEARLAALEWQEITPKNLPKQNVHELLSKYGEVVCCALDYHERESQNAAQRIHIDCMKALLVAGWTHFRPINPPAQAPKKEM
jgi:hypothetical protein